jgi:hypothetical protein
MHPILPLLNELEFWKIYEEKETALKGGISLFLIQAMLFAACSFASESVIVALGYTTVREARFTFYRRAKVRKRDVILQLTIQILIFLSSIVDII